MNFIVPSVGHLGFDIIHSTPDLCAILLYYPHVPRVAVKRAGCNKSKGESTRVECVSLFDQRRIVDQIRPLQI